MAQLATANGEKNTTHANYLQAQAAKEAVEARIKELEPFKSQSDELTKRITAAEAGSKQLRDRLLGIMKENLTRPVWCQRGLAERTSHWKSWKS